MTKGYGFSVNDIDWSSPADLEPYAKAHKLELQENDSIAYAICGNYVLSAISVAIDHCVHGKKAKSEYIKESLLSKAFENDGLTEEEIYKKELKKALLAEELWIKAGRKKGLPETIIKKKKAQGK